MICALCMSRKHRASHCPIKSQHLTSFWGEAQNDGASHRVHPGEQGLGPSELRNTDLGNDPMLRTPSDTYPMLHIRGRKWQA